MTYYFTFQFPIYIHKCLLFTADKGPNKAYGEIAQCYPDDVTTVLR